eukprot:NODE_557_length_6097_cov_0.482161.p4 type:complete len:184 gc:universal NODE_557_length_6097_cov_0.482161:2097-1546(-)
MAKSNLDEFEKGSEFKRVIPETGSLQSDEKVKKLVFCSGQVYYQLVQARDLNKIKDIAVVRIEEITPFPWMEVADQMDKYKNAEVVWTQEEPINMGMWSFVEPRLKSCANKVKHSTLTKSASGKTSHQQLRSDPIIVCARPASAAVATGMKKIHILEEQQLVSDALYGEHRPAKEVINGIPKY